MIKKIQLFTRRVTLSSRAADVNRYHLSQAMLEYQMFMAPSIEDGEDEVTRRTLKFNRNKNKSMKVVMKVVEKKKVFSSAKKRRAD